MKITRTNNHVSFLRLLTWRCTFFYSNPLKYIQTPYMTCSIANVKWPQCHKFVLKMGLKFDFERNTSTNTGYQEKLYHKWAKNCKFLWLFHKFIQENFCFLLIIMHGWRFQDFLAPKYHDYEISAHSYEFYLQHAQLEGGLNGLRGNQVSKGK